MADLRVRDFPDELLHNAKVAALSKKKSLKDFVIEAVREKLEREREKD